MVPGSVFVRMVGLCSCSQELKSLRDGSLSDPILVTIDLLVLSITTTFVVQAFEF